MPQIIKLSGVYSMRLVEVTHEEATANFPVSHQAVKEQFMKEALNVFLDWVEMGQPDAEFMIEVATRKKKR